MQTYWKLLKFVTKSISYFFPFFLLINSTHTFFLHIFQVENTSYALCKKHNKWKKITTMWGVEMENFCIFSLVSFFAT